MKYVTIIIAALFTFQLNAQSVEQRQKHFNIENNKVAIQGYDAVSYFKNNKPLKGTSTYQLTYKGVIYQFANAENKATFKANPSKYEPAWGGWCGYAMAVNGEKVAVNPMCYKIIDGRIVLFYKTAWYNALTNWNEEAKSSSEQKLVTKGDSYWSAIIK